MRIFVTGGSGYVGAHVVRCLLAAGHEVTVLSRAAHALRPLAEHGSLEVVAGDLRAGWDETALEGHDACVHAAIVWEDDVERPEVEDLAATRAVFRERRPRGLRAGSLRVVRGSASTIRRANVGDRPHRADR